MIVGLQVNDSVIEAVLQEARSRTDYVPVFKEVGGENDPNRVQSPVTGKTSIAFKAI